MVLTTSKAEEDVLRTYNLHANCYVTKPVDLEKFIAVVKSIDVFWLTVVTLPPQRHNERSRPHNVLLIEDNPGDARLSRDARGRSPAAPFDAAARRSPGARPRAALDGRTRPGAARPVAARTASGSRPSRKVYAHSPTVPIIVLTGNDDQTVALSAVKSGAQDYLVKGRLDRELLVRSMQYSIERKRYQVQLEHQANYDALTGLPNRNLLHDRLRQAVYSQRLPRAIAVVFIDLDHFKFVNDSPRPLDRRRAAQGAWPSACAPCCARATPWRASAATSSC